MEEERRSTPARHTGAMSLNVEVTVRVNPGRIARLLRLPGGGVERDIQRRTERVATEARRLAPGSIADNISASIGRQRGEISGSVTARHPAIGYVVNGTAPHQIQPRQNRPNARLRFVVDGRVVYATLVNHPGSRPNDFMVRALQAAR